MLLGFNPGAYSTVLNSQFISEQVKNSIIENLKDKYEGNIEVNIKSIPYKTVEIPDGKIEIKTNINSLSTVSIVKAGIYVNNKKVKTFGVRAEITIIKDSVWVARDWIKRGETLTSLKKEKQEITLSPAKLPGRNFKPAQYMARRNIKPGEVIELNDIQALPTIVRNSPVSVIFKTPSVSVTIPCTAVTSGKTGDFIKVKSKKFKKNYTGKIIGKNLVLVNI